jgi:uncharacterized membrane protein
MDNEDIPRAPRLSFDAVLRPHRSLSRMGFWLLMAGVFCVSFTAGLAFFLAGAWPVIGFLGLDVALIYVAFRANYRSGQMSEILQLGERELVVRRVSPYGRVRTWTFQPYWLRVAIDDPPAHDSQLTLSSHGRLLAIGAFLTAEERLELAQALRDALARQREVAPITTS